MSLNSFGKVAAWAAMIVAAPATVALAQTQLRGAQWPVVLETPQTADPEDNWSKEEIASALARCTAVAAEYGAVFEAIDPIRDGQCGTPYPVRLLRIEKVTLSQPATLNCNMVAAVGDWMRRDVQRLSKKMMGERVATIEVMSSYSCRNAYGRKRGRLSEHARANALDIRGFTFERGDGVNVLADWGMTGRDIKAKIAAAEKAARKLAKEAAKQKAQAPTKAIAQTQPQPEPHSEITAATPSLAEQQVQGGISFIPSADGWSAFRGIIGPATRDSDSLDGDRTAPTFIWGQPSRLGGPKAPQEGRPSPRKTKRNNVSSIPAVDAQGHTIRQRFLREIHDSACKRFGTALGPEANEAHRNHLHIDLAERGSYGSYCR